MADDVTLFLTSLSALRNQLLAVADTIEIVLETAQRPSAGSLQGIGDESCQHPLPLRTPTPAMGHPTRYHCRGCGKDVEK